MRVKQFLLGVLTGVVITLLGVAIVLAFVATRPLPGPVQSPPAVTSDMVVSVTESYLGRMATELARSEEESIQSVAVDVQPEGRIDMVVMARIHILNRPVDLKIELISSVRVAENRLRLSLLGMRFVGLSIPLELLPGTLRSTLEGMGADLNRQANNMLLEYGFGPVSVATDQSSIAVSLRAQ